MSPGNPSLTTAYDLFQGVQRGLLNQDSDLQEDK